MPKQSARKPDPKLNGAKRSNQWKTVRKQFLEGKTCAACGGKSALEAHHLIPFHLDKSKELDPKNLLALCERPGHDCHFRAHLFNWKTYDPDAVQEAARLLAKVQAVNRTGIV